LCGYYALAAAYALGSESDTTDQDYDAQKMADIIDNNLQMGHIPVATQVLGTGGLPAHTWDATADIW